MKKNMKNLYEKMFDKQLFITAYNKIKSNPGNMTPGSDNETLDGISKNWIETTISRLKTQSFKFKPSKRIFIPKKNGKMRPFGIPSPRDIIIQEIIKEILTKIYEPKFSEHSHGFRPNRSCHTALREVKTNVSTTWIIEGDIKGFFDNINHKILLDLLSKEIKDQRFLDLIRKAIKAGYIYENSKIPSNIGVPQGSILSPILSNIYLHEFDKFMEEQIELKSSKIPITIDNPEYVKYHNLLQRSKKWEKEGTKKIEDIKKIRKEAKKMRISLPSKIFIRGLMKINYIRYADDFIVNIRGEKNQVLELKEIIKKYLNDTLKIELSEEKTKITNIKHKIVKFLGTYIKQRAARNRHLVVRDKLGRIQRTSGNTIILEAPIQDLQKKLIEKGFFVKEDHLILPVRYKPWIGLTTPDMILRFNSIAQGIINYYSFAHNVPAIKKLIYLLKDSLVKTLGDKLKLSVKKVYKKFGKNIQSEKKSFIDFSKLKKD
jgi:nicotine oxidoreductase